MNFNKETTWSLTWSQGEIIYLALRCFMDVLQRDIAEDNEDVVLEDSYGESYYIPAGATQIKCYLDAKEALDIIQRGFGNTFQE